MNFGKCEIIDQIRLYNHNADRDGTAYVFDRLKHQPKPEQVEEWISKGAIVSERAYRYAPEIREMFVWIPDDVMVWACPDEECSGLYGEDPSILDYDGHSWTCSKCGCSTCAPIEDACYQMIELV